MDDAFLNKRDKTVDNLPQHFDGLLLLYEGGDLHVLLKIAVAELLNDVVII